MMAGGGGPVDLARRRSPCPSGDGGFRGRLANRSLEYESYATRHARIPSILRDMAREERCEFLDFQESFAFEDYQKDFVDPVHLTDNGNAVFVRLLVEPSETIRQVRWRPLRVGCVEKTKGHATTPAILDARRLRPSHLKDQLIGLKPSSKPPVIHLGADGHEGGHSHEATDPSACPEREFRLQQPATPMEPTLSVVVVNYNAGNHLRRCLDSLSRHLSDLHWDGIVVDNASVDDSEAVVGSYAPRLVLRRNPENEGFGRAANQGVAATTGTFCLFLNPDAEIEPHAVQLMCKVLDRQPGCAVVAPAVVNSDGTPQGNARGDPTMLTGLFGRTSMMRRLFPRASIARRNVVTVGESPPSGTGIPVDWVSGACMLVRRDVFERHRGFDESFFMYWEDADLCRRIRGSGHTICYLPEARVVHRVGRSSHTVPALAIRAFHKSAYVYYRRYVSSSRWRVALAFSLLQLRCQWHLVRLAVRRRGNVLEERDDVEIP